MTKQHQKFQPTTYRQQGEQYDRKVVDACVSMPVLNDATLVEAVRRQDRRGVACRDFFGEHNRKVKSNESDRTTGRGIGGFEIVKEAAGG